MTTDYYFYFVIVVCLVFSAWKLKKNHSAYKSKLKELFDNFNEISAIPESPIERFGEGAQQLVRRVCLTEKAKGRRTVVFSDGRVAVNQSVEQFIPPPPDQELKSLPTLLTIIGILGTFTGISFGLYNLGSGWEDAAQLVDRAKDLLGGMKTAFFTSLAGMSASGVAMITLSMVESWQYRLYSDYITKIADMVDEIQPSDLLSQSLGGIQQPENQHASLGELVEILKVYVNKPNPMTHDEFTSSIDSGLLTPLVSKIEQLRVIAAKTELKLDEVTLSLEKMQASPPLDEANLSKNMALAISQELAEVLPELVTQPLIKEISDQHDATTLTVQLLEKILVEISDTKSSITINDLENALEHKLSKPIKDQTSQISLIKECVTDFSQRLVKAQPPISANEFKHLFEQGLTEFLATPMKNEFQQSNQQLIKINAGITELSKDREQEFLQLISQMNTKIVLPITSELQQTNIVLNRFAKVSDELNQNVVKTVTEMARATSNIELFEHSTLNKLNDFATSMDSSLSNFAVQSESALTSITEKVGSVVKLGHESMKSQTEAFSHLIAESEKTFTSQGMTLKTIGEQAASLMVSAKVQLLDGLGDIDQKISGMSTTIQSELETFRVDYQSNLTAFFEQQNTALEDTLGKQRNSLVDVIDRFKAVFELEYGQRHELLGSFSKQHEELLKSANTIEHLAKAVGLHEASRLSEIEDAGDAIGRQVSSLKKEFALASNQFQLLVSQMQPQMDSYFVRATKSTEEYFASFDKVAARIYGRLDSAAELLITAKQEELAMGQDNKTSAKASS
ncbi:MAG: biopolymer transport protein ExbB/TolQ [Paraglaciecola sp.]|jgi:biopolymer transport protein ExbB/TolQ